MDDIYEMDKIQKIQKIQKINKRDKMGVSSGVVILVEVGIDIISAGSSLLVDRCPYK